MPKLKLDDETGKRIEDAKGRFHVAMKKIAPYVRPKEVEEPRATDFWRNGDASPFVRCEVEKDS